MLGKILIIRLLLVFTVIATTLFAQENSQIAEGNILIYKAGEKDVAYYSEGIFMGYRHFDKYNIDPLYEYGFGLSYTTFEFSDLKFSKTSMNKEDELTVELTVTNSGKVAGDEIVQLYISDKEASVEREVKSLKGFKRVSLKAGESKTVSMTVGNSALSFYDVNSKSWVVEPGEF